MPNVRNTSDRDLTVGPLLFPAGEPVELSDEWAAAVLTNPNFEAVAPKSKPSKASDNTQEG
jgi:hypothetical protein